MVMLGIFEQRKSSENHAEHIIFRTFGGAGGIRTHGTVAGTPDFESGPL